MEKMSEPGDDISSPTHPEQPDSHAVVARPVKLVHRSTSIGDLDDRHQSVDRSTSTGGLDIKLEQNMHHINRDEDKGDREISLEDLDNEHSKNGNGHGVHSPPYYKTRSHTAKQEQQASKQSPSSSEQVEHEDEGDAWGFGSRAAMSRNVARMPVEKDSETYNMNHPRRGVALIFNHMHFDPRLGLKQRNGTNADRENLRQTLRKLCFEVKVYDDLSYKDIDHVLEDTAADDHADADCLFVAVLSHGEQGILYSSDQAYKPDRIWSHFNAEKCPTLAAKPKMFIIQACQGDQLDSGMRLVSVTETDSSAHSYKIPTHADFLIAYSTIPGFYSWRNTSAGSWFVQALCYVLEHEAHKKDLLSILTRVSRRVALDFQSNTPGDHFMHEKKQIPCITSMLTRDIYFHRKPGWGSNV